MNTYPTLIISPTALLETPSIWCEAVQSGTSTTYDCGKRHNSGNCDNRTGGAIAIAPMSFRGDDQRRYGQVPPVQYAVGGQQEHHEPYDQRDDGLDRRSSFNTGDDSGFHDQPHHQAPSFDHSSGRGDELFLTNAGQSQPSVSRYASTASAMSGYQHQYQHQEQSQSSYNPQTFAPSAAFQRSQSTTLPYHVRQSSPSYGSYNAPSPPTNYTPQAYNPAAYAGTNVVPQRHSTYHGYATQDGMQNTSTISPSASSYGGTSPAATYNSAYSQPTRSTSVSTNYQPSFPTSPSAGHQASTGYDPSQYGSNAPYHGYGSNGAPYPTTSHIPVGPNYAGDHGSYYGRQRSDSQTSPRSSPYTQSQSPIAQRHPANAPLPNRPMDDVPEETPWDEHGRPLRHRDSYDSEGDDDYNEHTQESIMQDIEAELGASSYRQPPNGDIRDSREPSLGDGARSTLPAQGYDESDDDDPEGTAGVLAMQQAELDDQRFGGSSFMFSGPVAPPQSSTLYPPAMDQGQSSDSDIGFTGDVGMPGRGYGSQGSYGAELISPPGSSDAPRPLPTPGYYNSLRQSYDLSTAYDSAEVDYGGTGGLQPPRSERLSFDEGREERVSIHSQTSGTESPAKDEYQELFYHPGLSSRPLPALPGGGGPSSDSSSMLSAHNSMRSQQQHAHTLSADARYYQGDGPESYYQGAQTLQPERSISLSSYSNTPPVQAPARSRTDANDDRKKVARGNQGPPASDYDSTTAVAGDAFGSITLPSGRKKKFVPSKLTATEFNYCTEPWALSGIESWLRALADGELDLREKTVEEGLTNLFVFKIPTMNVADAEALGSQVVSQMLASETLLPEEEWVKFGEGHVSGVLWQLTGAGCYAPKLHEIEISGRCYAHHCTRTLKKVDLEMLQDEAPGGDAWNVFYSLKKEDWESKPRKEVDRQNILHEIVTGEENYIKQLDIFRTLYRDDLRTRNPPILSSDKRDKFLAAVFGKLDTVLRINKDHLLAQLKYRQQEQGPWIVGFSDIFREWIRKAKSDYIEYATGYPRATYMVRREAGRNLLLKKFLEDKQKHKSSSKQDWTHFLIAPLQRLQRYILLLQSVEHKMISDSEEKANLSKAIQEIQTVTHECDAKVAETNKRVEMMELDRMLVLRPGFQSVLNLDHLGRVLIKQGELQRMGSKGMRWVESHALLFDHYLILAKEVVPKDGRGEKKYDVSREVRLCH